MSDKITLLQKEVAIRGFEIQEISDNFTQNDYVQRACELMGMDEKGMTDYLWQTYNPSNIWMVFSGIGIATVIALFLYDRLWLKSE